MGTNDFIYLHLDELSPDWECSLCSNPFIDPVYFPSRCGQTFCRQCLQLNYEKHAASCTHCNGKPLSQQDIQDQVALVHRILGRLSVQCRHCLQQDIERGDFLQHMREICPKRNVPCPAKDVKCPWNGSHDQLNQHVHTCPYEQLRALLTELLRDRNDLDQLRNDHRKLADRSKEQEDRIKQLEVANQGLNTQVIQITTLTDQCKRGANENASLKQEINVLNEGKETLTKQIEGMKEDLDKKLAEIDRLSKEINRLTPIESEYEQIKTAHASLKEQYDASQAALTKLEEYTQKIANQLRGEEQISVLIQEKQKLREELDELQPIKEGHRALLGYYQKSQEENECLKQQMINYDRIQSENQQYRQVLTTHERELEKRAIKIKHLELKINGPIGLSSNLFCFATSNGYTNPQLEEFIENCQRSSLLNLNNEKLSEDDLNLIVHKYFTTLKYKSVILRNNALTERSFSCLFSFLGVNSTLTELCISNNIISDQAIQQLSESLSFRNSTLRRLVLNGNQIDDQGLAHLSNMLKSNRTLRALGLHENLITDQSMKGFCEAVRYFNQTLEEITLYSNALISDASLEYFDGMITDNQVLQVLWMYDCQFSDEGKVKLQQTAQKKDTFNFQV
ncbi:unnamed protein product [Adineta ricciae]|uniref:RING-type domain-containing protein n=1 Tax=Adineta ricciae TaxID=249248 RepID=A0A815CT86_ADIRI|nr:unnamed protein product [Adineta ricciae]CAF1287927.1 unnamed protein product [Adineta ricciae]